MMLSLKVLKHKQFCGCIAVLALTGCNATPEQWEAANRAWGNYQSTQRGGQYQPAASSWQYQLQTQQLDGAGNRYCRYSNGSVLNVGRNFCPPSIQ